MRPLLQRPAPSSGAVLAQLDALRGVAILAVFLQHFGDRFMPFVDSEAERALPAALVPWLLTVLHHAHWGVDLFFALSGFSLAQGFVRAIARARPVSTRSFYLRRAARILPGYYVAIAVMLVAHRTVFTMPGFGLAMLVHLLVLQGYFWPGGIVLIGASWSLTTEICFYLLLPFLARPLLTPGWQRWVLGAALVLGAWLSRAALHAIFLVEPGVRTAMFEATQRRWISSRLDEFVLGALAAALHAEIVSRGLGPRASRYAPVGMALAIVMLVIGFRFEGELLLVPGGSWPYAIVSLATAALVLSAVLTEGLAKRMVAPRALCLVGVVSYGFFLYHQLAIGLVGSKLGGSGWPILIANLAAALALSLAMGAASWVWIERPVMEWARDR